MSLGSLGELNSYGDAAWGYRICFIMGTPSAGNPTKIGINVEGFNYTSQGGGSLLLFGY